MKTEMMTERATATWETTEPPKDGTPIVAIGRVISRDEFSTWAEPFLAGVVWFKDGSGFEGWHYRSDGMTVARTLDDEVKVDWWARFPEGLRAP